MSKALRSLIHAMNTALLCLGAWAPLNAQLDTRLQSTPTDLIDLYQGVTASGILKPEVLLVMDFSTSTNRMMFHPLFPNNFDDEERFDNNSDYYSVYVTIGHTGSGSSAVYSISQVGFGQGTLDTTFKISNKNYTIGGSRTTYSSIPTNTLIKPDGTEVTEADVKLTVANANLYRSGSTTPQSYALNWVRSASHVRMQCVNGGVTRNIDIPINWAVLDKGTTGTPLASSKATNPTSQGGDGATYEIDSTYLGNANGGNYNQLRESGDKSTAECGSAVGNVRLYRSRYIEWIFWGQTSGSYFVPDAITASSAVNPATIAYTGSTGTFSWSTASISKTAFDNGLPNRNRNQAIKEAFLKTWFNNQTSVSFAYRTLLNSGSTSNGSITTPYAFDTNQWGVLDPATPSTWTAITGQPPSSGGGTPLVPTQFDAYCQMTSKGAFATQEAGLTKAQLDCQQHFVILLTDGSPTVNVPNEGATSFPYISTTGAQSIYTGNTTVKGALTSLNQSNAYWNNATLAAVAAHGGARSSGTATDWVKDPTTPNYSTAGTPSTWAPFWVQTRKFGGASGTDYTLSKPHPIQTMTVGVSLGGYYKTAAGQPWPTGSAIDSTAVPIPIQQDTNGSKFRLLMAAMCGDPAPTSLTASTTKAFYRSGATKASDAAYFFDGRDPATLIQSLQDAFTDIQNMSAVSTTAAPVIPFVGQGLGQQIYITRFIPAVVSTNPVWNGDLTMFSTRLSGDTLQILDNSGTIITDLNASMPNWSADNALRNNRQWSARQVWTRLPNGTALQRFTPLDDGTGGAPANAYSAIKASLATTLTTDAAKQQLVAWNLGADVSNPAYSTPSTPNPACPNRPLPAGQTFPPGDILGDLINSTPAVAEYTLTSWIQSQLSSKLQAQVTAAGGISATPHFRVIFVGTNRGFLHAFGEVSYTQGTLNATTGVTTYVTKGDVDELWAFMPTEFLDNLDTIGPTFSGKHRYGVDGTPYVWFLDLPATDLLGNTIAVSGNGKIDYDSTSTANSEKAMLIFGLRKGGRSYYGLNIQNPFTPTLGWSLVPDEAASLTASNLDADAATTVTLASLKTIVQNMGFSSCLPASGRVLLGASPKVRDAVFLGGGYSTPEVEANFTGTPALGRSAVALDPQTGKVFAAWNFSGLGMGPVASGLVPFEFFLNSGFVQRAYFTDYKGGLWALGSGYTNPSSSSFPSFRRDSNALDQWTVDGVRGSALNVRHIYQDSGTNGKSWRDSSGHDNAIFSIRPAPFLIGSYPGVATWTDSSGTPVSTSPAAVGIAVVSGDRDNPLDKNYTTTTIPNQHRLSMIFDRQDSARTGIGLTSGLATDANLSNFTTQTTAPATNYLNDNGGSTKVGYYLNFPAATVASDGNTYVPKGIYEPIVLSRVLFYSYFTPSSCTCSGGDGNTYTNQICDALFPAWPGNGVAASTAAGCQSGQVASWFGVSSPMGVLSTAAAIQSGIQNFTPAGGGAAVPGVAIKVFEGQLHEKFPKVRTWRTVR